MKWYATLKKQRKSNKQTVLYKKDLTLLEKNNPANSIGCLFFVNYWH